MKTGICAVVGQVVSSSHAVAASNSDSDLSSKITSGMWQDALTIASNAVWAIDTRKPAAASCAARSVRVRGLPSAIKTCVATVAGASGADANTLDRGREDAGLMRSRRCTAATASKKFAEQKTAQFRPTVYDLRPTSIHPLTQ